MACSSLGQSRSILFLSLHTTTYNIIKDHHLSHITQESSYTMFILKLQPLFIIVSAIMVCLTQSFTPPSSIRPMAHPSLQMTNQIQRLETSNPRMSQLVIHNNIVYTSGQINADSSTAIEQTRAILDEIDRLLALAGTDKSKVIKAMIWLSDIERDFDAMNEVWEEWIDKENKPVRACTEGKLAADKFLVEIQVEAAL